MNSPSKVPPIIKDNLVLWFDPIYYTGSITGIRDNSGTGNTISSQTSISYNGGPPSNFNFNGSTSVLKYNTSTTMVVGSGDFTYSIWAYFNSFSNSPNLLDTRSTSITSTGLAIYMPTGKLSLYLNGTGQSSSITSPTLKWQHLVVSRISNIITFYTNGVSGGTVSNSFNFSDNTNFWIGENISLTGFLNGNIGQILVYKGLGLTQNQVTQNFNNSRIYYGI